MTIAEKITAFIDEYNTKLQNMNSKLVEASNRVDDLQLEINFINVKELPAAVEKRVLEGDAAQETRLKKTLIKLQAQLQDNQEIALVLTNAIQKHKAEAAAKITDMEKLYREEKQLIENRQYGKIMNAKKSYVETIIKEASAIREANALSTRIQEVQYQGGKINSVTAALEVKSAPIKAHLDFHNGVYLQLDLNEVKRLVAGTYTESDIDYLNKFAHKKDL